ncbi:MAG: hypothetical protein AAF487_04630 [Bacteroidota bacterium]
MKHLIPIFLAFCLLACGEQELSSLNDFESYINDEQNGLTRTKHVNGYFLKWQLLPNSFLEKKEEKQGIQNDSEEDLNRGKSIYCLFSIIPDEQDKTQDIVLENTMNVEEFKRKYEELSFYIQEDIRLKTGDGNEISPVLAHMEPVHQLKKGRTFNLVFAPRNEAEFSLFEHLDELDFVYDDRLFSLGMNHFVFDKKNLVELPQLTF